MPTTRLRRRRVMRDAAKAARFIRFMDRAMRRISGSRHSSIVDDLKRPSTRGAAVSLLLSTGEPYKAPKKKDIKRRALIKEMRDLRFENLQLKAEQAKCSAKADEILATLSGKEDKDEVPAV